MFCNNIKNSILYPSEGTISSLLFTANNHANNIHTMNILIKISFNNIYNH